ncbi:MAG TPA: ribonuclease III [bacterium]|nr:ribonuclease III [bacterium]HPN30701.1 ribonuclease III [bacterium]
MKNNFDKSKLDGVLNKIGYKFKNRNLLYKSLLHSSYVNEEKVKSPDSNIESNERMEFLGDALIGTVVSEYLYISYPEFSEYEMTAVKSHVVSRANMKSISDDINLSSCFITSGISESDKNKAGIASNMLESLVCAAYLDSSYKTVYKIVIRLFKNSIIEKLKSADLKNYKSKLQEYSELNLKCKPEYRTVGTSGKEHNINFKVEVYLKGVLYGTGSGPRIKEAEKKAAFEALINLKNGV